MNAPENLSPHPRVTMADIKANIVSEHYFTAFDGAQLGQYGGISPETASSMTALGLLTFCVLVLRNGFTVTGHSACVSPMAFDADIGRTIARDKAVEQIWPLMGYELKQRMSQVASEVPA
jgi:hypothetical protein